MKVTAKIIKEYQCCGCISGPYPACFVVSDIGHGCGEHYSGTTACPFVGKIFLGLPKGFDRIGYQKDMKLYIFENQKEQEKIWNYDKFNVPVWKYQNEKGHIFVRGYIPRLNQGFIHIILEGDFDKIKAQKIDPDTDEMD